MSNAVASLDTRSFIVIGGAKIPRAQQMVLDLLIAKQRNGVSLVTAGELRDELERVHAPRRFDKGWVTARLDDMRHRGLVDRSEEVRFNSITRKSSGLWFLPLHQARLCA